MTASTSASHGSMVMIPYTFHFPPKHFIAEMVVLDQRTKNVH